MQDQLFGREKLEMGKLTENPTESLYKRIVNAYAEYGSVKEVARKCHASEVTVRRVLITEGLWSSRSSRRIEELRQQGMSVSDIAALLSVSEKAVEAYLPYSRGMYGQGVSEDARHSSDYRERVNAAREKVNNLSRGGEGGSISSDNLSGLICDIWDFNISTDRGSSDASAHNLKSETSLRQGMDLAPVLCLHLELVEDPFWGDGKSLGLRKESQQRLFSLAKAEQGISRDILVPENMNLHALHYAIQRLFGWQNSHLHNFSLSDHDFERVTGEIFGEYAELCGILFRFPNDDFSDLYWDDDYEDQISVKSWLQKKYRAPFRCECLADSWLSNQWEVDDFCEHFPEFCEEDSLKHITDQVMIEEKFNCLIERLSVGELLLAPTFSVGVVRDWKENVRGKLLEMEKEMLGWDVHFVQGRCAADELRKWRQSMQWLDYVKWQNPRTYRSEVRRQTGQSYEETLDYYREMAAFWEERCGELIFDWNILLEPCFHELYYFYDYGDDWCVRITAVEEMSAPPADVEWDGNAVCVEADGLNLVDDCGGIHGYLEMLETIHGSDREEAQNMREWARGLGWTGRKSKPAKML